MRRSQNVNETKKKTQINGCRSPDLRCGSRVATFKHVCDRVKFNVVIYAAVHETNRRRIGNENMETK